ncbi:hypothetical protein Taro_025208 [Colocasia esculenta]|uniref:Uncharacterized protein n=1 Tax=Colocasia esculenta TaxID=4460 RepID=A0A843VGW9_COLES|nr:hypothetical protein [Colocasia esculenta]
MQKAVIATHPCKDHDGIRQIVTESYEDRDGSFGQAAKMRQGSLSLSDRDRYLCRDGPENAAYWVVTFSVLNFPGCYKPSVWALPTCSSFHFAAAAPTIATTATPAITVAAAPTVAVVAAATPTTAPAIAATTTLPVVTADLALLGLGPVLRITLDLLVMTVSRQHGRSR